LVNPKLLRPIAKQIRHATKASRVIERLPEFSMATPANDDMLSRNRIQPLAIPVWIVSDMNKSQN